MTSSSSSSPGVSVGDQPDLGCPLCGEVCRSELESVPFKKIWTELSRQWGGDFSPATIARHTTADRTTLYQCARCGLHYFHPAAPGDTEFYDELGRSPQYYVPEKWEFEVISTALRPSWSVLDVGCGEGAFLKKIVDKVAVARGIETNPDGRRRATNAQLDVVGDTITQFASDKAETFDVVCAFQVIEHLPAILPFLLSALACVKPGGWLIVSVPNRDRILRNSFEPLDCPPHHISRWSGAQLRLLAKQLGCAEPRLLAEPIDRSAAVSLLRHKMSQWSRGAVKPDSLATRLATRFLVRGSVFALLMKWGLFDRLRWHRHSLLAILEKPSR